MKNKRVNEKRRNKKGRSDSRIGESKKGGKETKETKGKYLNPKGYIMYLYVPLCTFLKKKVWCHLYEYMVGFSCLHGKGWGKKMHFWF